MAIPKTLGIETEYGIWPRGADESNPIAASSMLINAYLHDLADVRSSPAQGRVGLRGRVTRQRRPRLHAARRRCRPTSRRTSSTRCSPTGRATTSITRTPSCPRPSAPTVVDRPLRPSRPSSSCERSMNAARRMLPPGQELVVYKNNSDGKGNSYGCHENYLMDRHTPFGRIVTHATAHFVSRQIFTGAGKVGTEAHGLTAARRAVPAHPARRLLRGGGRPRDHAQAARSSTPATSRTPTPQKYRRLHVIVGDANMSEVVHLPQGRHDRVRAHDGRGRLPAPRASCSRRRCRRCARCPTTSRSRLPLRLADGIHRHRARHAVGALRTGAQVRRRTRHRQRRRSGGRAGARTVGSGAHRCSRTTP